MLTLGIWLVAGFYFGRRISETDADAAAVNTRYMQAQELLSTVRSQVLLESVLVRDALLDPKPSADDYRRQVEQTYQSVMHALQQYVPVLDAVAERTRVERLQREVDDFQRTMRQVLATDSTQWNLNARQILRTQVVPKRETVIRISEETLALNRSMFVQQQREIRVIYAAGQQRLWLILGLTLAASISVTLVAALYAGRLEQRVRQQSLEDARSAAELQRLSSQLLTAQEEERRSIARELHDEVGQVLTAIKVELAVAQRAIEAHNGSPALLEDARRVTDGALATVRDLSHLLHPALLDDLGLPAAIEWYLRGFGRRHEIRAELLHQGIEGRLPPEIETTVYRIVQEALTNVAKHARATGCRVYLQRLPNTILVTIEDDGVGFDAAAVIGAGAAAGLGLIGIRERASHLRGTVRLESGPHNGTRLTVELPVHSRDVVEPGQEARSPGLGHPAPVNG